VFVANFDIAASLPEWIESEFQSFFDREIPMKTIQRFSGSLVALAVLIGVGGCSGMSRQDQSTLAGAGIGGVAGAVLTDGSAIGTVGGAVVGGVIGHEVSADRDGDGNRNYNQNWDGNRNYNQNWDGNRNYNQNWDGNRNRDRDWSR
jgi:osmotically inducible lipoprotein OsmB